MHKFIIKIIPFGILTLLIGILRFYAVYDARHNFYNYTNTNIENKIVFIGDSKSLFGIDEIVFNEKDVVNLSSWGAQPHDNLNSLNKYEIKNSIIFIVVTSRIFLHLDTTNHSVQTKNSISGIFDYNLYQQLKNQFKRSEKGSWEYQLQRGGSMYLINQFCNYHRYNWKEDSNYHSKLLVDSQSQKIMNTKINHLLEIYNKFTPHNIVFFIDLPERKDFDVLIRSYENNLFKSIEKRSSLSVIDFGVYNEEYFYDSHHLNKNGSKKFTSELLNFITSSNADLIHQGSN